jgi:hypothetical protein
MNSQVALSQQPDSGVTHWFKMMFHEIQDRKPTFFQNQLKPGFQLVGIGDFRPESMMVDMDAH